MLTIICELIILRTGIVSFSGIFILSFRIDIDIHHQIFKSFPRFMTDNDGLCRVYINKKSSYRDTA